MSCLVTPGGKRATTVGQKLEGIIAFGMPFVPQFSRGQVRVRQDLDPVAT